MRQSILKATFLLVTILSAEAVWSDSVTVGQAPVRQGGTVQIAVSVAASTDLGGMNLRLEYDPAVFVSADASSGPLLDTAHVLASYSPEAGKFNVLAYAPQAAPPFTAQTGTLCTISLRVSPSATPGIYPITFSTAGTPLLASSGLSDMTGTGIDHQTDPGSVTVFETLVTDLNTDGEVTEADLIILRRDWHKWHYYLDPLPADINQDEWVNEKDLMILQKDWHRPPGE